MRPAVWGVGLVLLGCGASAQREAQTALDVAQIACVIANAESDDATVQEICHVADALLPDLRKILAEQRAASRRFAEDRAAQLRRARDGGTHDAP